MKKLNKKGITIAELIVSFVLVTVAVTYFYQTIDTVHDLYVTATKETQEYVDKTYAMRIIDAYIKEKGIWELKNEIGVKSADFCNKYSMANCDGLTINYYDEKGISNNTLNINGKSYSYVTAINDEELNKLALSSDVQYFFGLESFTIETHNSDFEETITIKKSDSVHFERTYKISDDRINALKDMIEDYNEKGNLDYVMFDVKSADNIGFYIGNVEYDSSTEKFSVYNKDSSQVILTFSKSS